MTQETIPCRLNVILAREAHKAVIFRRGPSNWVRLILWDTRNDTFEYGQWFKGRIYEDRCDLSPDGSKLVYFAAKHYSLGHRYKNGYTNVWTAISKPPYFTALAMWTMTGTYGGGGLFERNDSIWLNHTAIFQPHPNHMPPESLKVEQGLPNNGFYNEDELRSTRLERSGWIELQKIKYSRRATGWYTTGWYFEQPQIMEKYHPYQPYSIVIQWSWSKVEFWLKDRTSQSEIPIDTDRWADWDHQGRLVYVNEGKLYVHEDKLFVAQVNNLNIQPKMIGDFNAQKPKAIIAPDWAKRW